LSPDCSPKRAFLKSNLFQQCGNTLQELLFRMPFLRKVAMTASAKKLDAPAELYYFLEEDRSGALMEFGFLQRKAFSGEETRFFVSGSVLQIRRALLGAI
jgi:hypothetical protein